VEEAGTMDWASAHTGPAAMRAPVATKTSRLRRVGMVLSFLCSFIAGGTTAQTSNSPRMNRRASSVLGSTASSIFAGGLPVDRYPTLSRPALGVVRGFSGDGPSQTVFCVPGVRNWLIATLRGNATLVAFGSEADID